jgi:Ca-activated chloride channel homolog
VKYSHREVGQDITPVLPAVTASLVFERTDPGEADPLIGRTDWYWMFAIPAAVLLILELALATRDYRRNSAVRAGISGVR